MRRALVPVLLLLPLTGCLETPPDDLEEVRDEGEACLVDVTTAPYGTGVVVEAGEAATVRVGFGDCAPCGEDIESTCSVSVEGEQLAVSAVSSWVPLGDDVDCPADCRPWFAECTSEALEAGSYVLAYGGGTEPFTVPSSGAIICAVSD